MTAIEQELSRSIYEDGMHIPSAPFTGRAIKKTVFTVNIGPSPGEVYAPEICDLTYPLMKAYAKKIGADFHVISERKFPDWPVVYEKLQVHQLGREMGNDWNIVIDSDTLINPEFFDVTEQLKKDTVAHNGRDFANVRWKYDQYFRRDGRGIGSCNWFTVASDWCLDLWKPLDDLTFEQAVKNIQITVNEYNSGCCKTEHLIDDYTLSRNISKFGLKFDTIVDMCGRLGWRTPTGQGVNPFLFHQYTISNAAKVERFLEILSNPQDKNGWGLVDQDFVHEYKQKWGMK